jgi:hypothetical protein
MRQHERLYLLLCAEMTRAAAARAQAAGEEFHLVGGFIGLEDLPVMARAQWDGTRLILRMRFDDPKKVTDEALDRIAAVFFANQPFTAMPTVFVDSRYERACYQDDPRFPT